MKKLKASDLENFSGNVRIVYTTPDSVEHTPDGWVIYKDDYITPEVEFVRYDKTSREVFFKRKSKKEHSIKGPLAIFQV